MKSAWSAKAYAKVNFNLKVLPAREDGFHNLESIFQTVGLYDELIVTLKNGTGCQVVCDSMDLPEKNTLSMAYDAFCEVVKVNVPGIKVLLKKGIPSGGGLGGGSADAGALLRILQKICKVSLTNTQLDYIAGKTGSDVFFFVHCNKKGQGCALVSGRGEVVKTISSGKSLPMLMVFPGIHSSTKEAYSLVDEMLNKGDLLEYPSFENLETVFRKDPKEWTFNNTFSPMLELKYPKIKQALDELKKTGAVYSVMSGSGSTVFGVYTSKKLAKKSAKILSNNWSIKLVHTL